MVYMREGSNIDEDEIRVTDAAPQSDDIRLYENTWSIGENVRGGERAEEEEGERRREEMRG